MSLKKKKHVSPSAITESTTASSNNTDFKINLNKNKKDAAKNIYCALVVHSWRLKREEVKSLRQTLALQTSRASRLQLHASSLKYLLETDDNKVRSAMAEVSRMREELNARSVENSELENERSVLHQSACEAQERATGLQGMWQSCKNDLAAARLDAAAAQRLLLAERAKVRRARDQNALLLEKIAAGEETFMSLQRAIKESQLEMFQVKKTLASRDEYIMTMESELITLKESNRQQQMQIKGKDSEMETIKLQVVVSNEEKENLCLQLETANRKLNRWPFHLMVLWPPYSSIPIPIIGRLTNGKSWLGLPSNMMQRFFNLVLLVVR